MCEGWLDWLWEKRDVGCDWCTGENKATLRRENGQEQLESVLRYHATTQDAVLHGQSHHTVHAHIASQHGLVLFADNGRRESHHDRISPSRSHRVSPGRACFYSCVHKKKRPPFYLSNNSVKNQPILMIFGVWNHEKVDISSLCTCPPYLYTVATLPWEVRKSHFSTVLLIQTSDYYVISEETNCNCCTAAYLTYRCLLLIPIVCVALFYGQFFYLFGQSFSKPPMPTHNRLFSKSPTFGGTQHYLQSDVKVLHFTR